MSQIGKLWGSLTVIANAVSVAGTMVYTSAVDLETNGYEGAHVTIYADFPASPTDHLDWWAFGSLDGSAWDATAFTAGQIDKGTDPNQISIIIRDVARFRIGMKRSGATDTITVTVKHKSWKWQNT